MSGLWLSVSIFILVLVFVLTRRVFGLSITIVVTRSTGLIIIIGFYITDTVIVCTF